MLLARPTNHGRQRHDCDAGKDREHEDDEELALLEKIDEAVLLPDPVQPIRLGERVDHPIGTGQATGNKMAVAAATNAVGRASPISFTLKVCFASKAVPVAREREQPIASRI
ncbi:hypothetical protein LZK76_05385 [Rhizobium leguminosarum]|nr:hypothetical protein LZK76_05385 [Rhizobium leguminosarum]